MVATVNTLGADHLLEDYRIERVMAIDESSITYFAVDTRSNEPVTIREYFPFAHAVRMPNNEVRPYSLDVAAVFKQGRDTFHELAWRFAKIDHPGVAKLEHVLTANNTVYHVLQYVAGATLFDLLEHRRRLSKALLQRLFADTLPALAEIHGHGATHGNIDPRHLVLRTDGRWIMTGVGAPSQHGVYTAPESPAGAEPPSDPRGDLYAFGVVAYRCISGLSEQGIADAARAQHGQLLPPAQQAGAGRFSRQILDAIDLARQSDPATRPASARELLAAAMTTKSGTRSVAPLTRRRGLLVAMTLVALVAAIAGIWRHEDKLSAATGLAVYSNVAGAQVFLDGALVGTTAAADQPLLLNRLTAGPHALRVVESLHEPFVASVTIEKGAQTRVPAQLQAKSVAVTVAANVADYQLYVDDQPVEASAPNEYRLPMGQRALRVEKPGYLSHTQTLQLFDTAGQTLTIELEPECRQIARVEQRCVDQPLQRFREQLVTQSKPVRQRARKEMRVLGNARYRNTSVEELQYAACSGAKHDVEDRLQDDCRLEPRAGQFFVSDIDFGQCRCEITYSRDVYGRRALASVDCSVAASAMCAVEVKRAVRYMDANPQCEDVLVTDTVCK